MSKKELLKKLKRLVLLTDVNIQKLTSLIERAEKESDLIKIEKFIDQEGIMIEQIFSKIFENAEKNKNPALLKNLEEIFNAAKKDLFQVSKLEEHSDKGREEAKAAALLNDF